VQTTRCRSPYVKFAEHYTGFELCIIYIGFTRIFNDYDVEKVYMAKFFTQKFVELECNLRMLFWFGRVPSHNNPSDGSLYLDFNSSLLRNCKRTRINFGQIGAGFGCTGETYLKQQVSSVQS